MSARSLDVEYVRQDDVLNGTRYDGSVTESLRGKRLVRCLPADSEGPTNTDIPGLHLSRIGINDSILQFCIDEFSSHNFYGKNARRMRHYGLDIYGFSHISDDIPNELTPLVAAVEGLTGSKITMATIVKYGPGDALPPHCDLGAAGSIVATISISGSSICTMAKGDVARPLRLEHGDVTIMSGEARYWWTHSIQNAGEVRYSVVLRNPR